MEKNFLQKQANRSGHHTGNHQSEQPKRVAYYIRVSTEEQAENPEGSIKNQEERLNMTLKLKNTDTSFGRLIAVYCDAGRSGKDMNRPELQKLLKAIEAKEINLVMVSELSRLSRSIKDFSQIWEFMQAYGCGFVSLRENFDTSTAAGEMMLYSIANFAQFERKQTSERVSANLLARAQRGLWNGGVLPMGYEPDPDIRGSLRIVEDEAKVVRAAFQALLDQGSVFLAAKWLNQNGYSYRAPLRGGGCMPRNKHFTFDCLYRLLRNHRYTAVREVKTKDGIKLTKAVWPPIIDSITFERAQKIIDAGKRQKTGRESRYPYLLSTRIYCEECGRALIGVSAHGATTKVPYYGHGTQLKNETVLNTTLTRCNPYRVPGRKIEERVWHEVLAIIESPTHRKPLFEAILKLSECKTNQLEIKQKNIELIRTTEMLANLAHRIAELPRAVPAEDLYAEMRRLGDVKTRLEEEISKERLQGQSHQLATEGQYNRLLEKLKNQISEGNVSHEIKRKIIHALVHKVVVTKAGFELHFFVGSDQMKTGEVISSPAFSLTKKIFDQRSFFYLNGGPSKNRTCNKALGKLRYIHLTMGPPSGLYNKLL